MQEDPISEVGEKVGWQPGVIAWLEGVKSELVDSKNAVL